MPAQKPRSKADPRNKAAAVPAPAPVAKADDNKAAYVPMAFALPELPTGGTLATWKSDLARIKSISVSKDNGATWITVQGSGKISIPEDQRKAVTFLGLSRISSPTSDRGMAYRMWAHQYHDLLLERLGKYSIKIEFGTKSIIGGYLFSVQDALSTNESEYKFLAVSLEKFQPRKREATVKADTEVVYDLVL